MIFLYPYVVITHRGGPGGYDHGSWSGHNYRREAIEAAEAVSGTAFKVGLSDDNHTLTEVK